MSQRPKTRIRIRNEEFVVAGGSSPEQLQAAAAYVDEIVDSLTQAAVGAPPGHVALLAALNIASELLELRRQFETLQATVNGGSQRMLDLIEKRVRAVR